MQNERFERDRGSESQEKDAWISSSMWGLIALASYLGLFIVEDELRAGNVAAADIAAAGKLLLVCMCATAAWRRSTNGAASGWSMAARAALILAIGITAVTL